MNTLVVVLSCLLAGASAGPFLAGFGDEAPQQPPPDKAAILHKVGLLVGLEHAIREKTEQQVDPNVLKDIHEDFVKYAHIRHEFEEAHRLAQAVEGKEDLLKAAFAHFLAQKGAQPPQIGQGQSPFGGQGQSPFGGQGQSPFGGQGQSPFGGQGQSPFGGQGQSPFGGEGPFGQGKGPIGGFGDGPFGFGGQKPEGGLPFGPQGGPQEGPKGPADLKLLTLFKLFVEFENAFLEQINIKKLGLDAKATRALFFETFGRFLKNSIAIKEQAAFLPKIHEFVVASQQKAALEQKGDMKGDFQQFVQHLLSQK